MALTRSGAKKILLFQTLVQGAVILTLAASFAFITSRDSSVIREIITGYASSVALDKGRSCVAASWKGNQTESRELMEKLFAYCRSDSRILSVILFSKTADENFFKVSSRIDLGSQFTLPEVGQRVKEGTDENWLKKGLYGETIDKTIYADKAKTLYWHNVYIPVKCRDGQFVVRLTISSSEAVLALDEYLTRTLLMKRAMIAVVAVLLIITFAASALFLRNFTLLISGLTGYVKKAAGGDTALNLSSDVDEDLSELALSFNTLVGELREKDRTIGELREREKTAAASAVAAKDETSKKEHSDAVTDLQTRLEQARVEKEKILAEQNKSDELSEVFRRGVEMLKENKLEEAASVFTVLTILKPDGFGGYFNLGVTCAKLGNFDRSLDMFYRALEINPNHTHTTLYIEKVRRLREKHALS
jgi:methyl-accepting chemotaxis protein